MAHATRHGLRCAIHAIGDAANALALDAFAASGAAGSIEHAQLVSWDDVERFAALGVVASVQPEHAMDDRDVADRHWAGRTDRAFAFGSLHRAGRPARARVRRTRRAPRPVGRRRRRGHAGPATGAPPWHPEQAHRPPGRAGVLRRRPRAGTVAVGAPADLVVLDADPLTAPLRGMPVAGTLVAGDWTHRAF